MLLGQEETYERPAGRQPPSDPESLRLTARVIVRSLPIILATAILAVLGSLAFSSREQPRYQAVASLGLNSGPYQQALVGGYNPVDVQRQLQTTAYMLKLPAVGVRTESRLRRRYGSATLLGLGTTVPKNSDVIQVSAFADEPEAAAAYANTTIEEYLKYRKRLNATSTAEARRTLQQQTQAAPTSGERRQLIAKRNNLAALSALEDNQLQLLERATPPAKASDSLVRNAAIALVLGLLLGTAISLLRPQYRPPPK